MITAAMDGQADKETVLPDKALSCTDLVDKGRTPISDDTTEFPPTGRLHRLHSALETHYKGPNPFVTTTPLTIYEKLKMVLLTPTIVPIRFLLVFLSFCTWWLLAKLSVIGKRNMSEPNGWIRNLWSYPMRFMARLILFWSGFVYIPVVAPRQKPPAELARVVVANHVSIVDALTLLWVHGVVISGKKEIFSIPILGTILHAMQFIPVDRSTNVTRENSKKELARRIKDTRFPPVLIFPEGTTSIEKVLTQFQGGAFGVGMPVQPILLRYPHCHYDHAYVDGTGWTLWRMWSQVLNFTTVQYLDVYKPSEQELKEPFVYANNVQQCMAKELGAHFTTHNYLDVKFFLHAHKTGLKLDISTFSLNDLKELATLSYDNLLEHLERFKQLDQNHDGFISFEEFSRTPNLAKCSAELKKELFAILDHEETGKVAFKEYVLGASAAMGRWIAKDILQLAFKEYDVDKDGVVSRRDAQQALTKLSIYSHEPEFQTSLEQLLDKVFSPGVVASQQATSSLPAAAAVAGCTPEEKSGEGQAGQQSAAEAAAGTSAEGKAEAAGSVGAGGEVGGKKDGAVQSDKEIVVLTLETFAEAVKKNPDFIRFAFFGCSGK